MPPLNDQLAGIDAADDRSAIVADFIRENLRIAPVPFIPEISLYAPHSGSGLRRLEEHGEEGAEPKPPYWAYAWAGGAVLARHFLDQPEAVRGRNLLDLGAGGGIVGIAAAKAGASPVTAVETDGNAIVALGLNAAANDVQLSILHRDITGDPPPAVDVVAAGDVFYAPEVAGCVTAFLDRCITAGIEVLVGDPGRAFLPRSRLRLLAQYPTPDVGEASGVAPRSSGVFAFE